MRGEQQKVVGQLGEPLHFGAALGAIGEVLEGAAARLALDHAQRQLRGQLTDLLAAGVHHSNTSISERSLSIAVRIRVFTVPSGMSSRSLISRAVRPMYADSTRARR